MINARLRVSLRLKLLLLSAFLFSIPILGYQYVWEMEKYLRIGQEKTLLGTVRAVATALHERPKLFDKQASFLPSVQPGRDLYAHPIISPIRLDGRLNDWPNQQYSLHYGKSHLLTDTPNYAPADLAFTHMVGKYGNYLYAYFSVTDDQIVYRPQNSLAVDNNDLLQIALISPQGEFKRYLIAAKEPGWLTTFELDTTTESNIALKPENSIQGVWQLTEQGYNIELRLPLSLLGSELSFAISDLDNNETEIVSIGTAPFVNPEELGTVLVPSPEIERIIKGLGHSESKVWVIDQHGRVLATAGDIKDSSGLWSNLVNKPTEDDWYSPIQSRLKQLYAQILTTPPKDFVDELRDAVQLEGDHINKALKGNSATSWRLTTDNKAVILSAAHPIYSDDQVMGVVVAEETTHGIRTLRNQALEQWFNVILAVMGLGTLALFIFASRISSRIRSLRNQTEQAIDDQGRIIKPIENTKATDEVGDLQRSFANLMTRLSQYTHYLQGMSARLSHELRTPVAVVSSSLESLQMDQPDIASNVYLTRAKEGVSRLSSILTLMSEATRIEHSLENTEKHTYPIVEVISGCVQGYQLTQPNQKFELSIECDREISVDGSPELMAQLLDKLLANAVEFARTDSVIEINLQQTASQLVVTVANQGALLPEEMQGRLFDSMVSVRKSEADQQPHLGLGLYIARLITEYHSGQIELHNNNQGTGVEAIIRLPFN